MRVPNSTHNTARPTTTLPTRPTAAASSPVPQRLGFERSTFERTNTATLRLQARIQPGIRAWAAPANVVRPLSADDDGAYLGALGQPLPSTLDLDDVAGVLPSDGRKPEGRVVFINGVASTRGTAASQMQQIADMTGAEVVGLYNATDGVVKDVVQVIGDRLDVGENKAVTSLTRLILSSVREGEPLRLAGYSQGAAITSRALEDAKQALMQQDGLSRAQAEAKLSLVHVETFGGAASHYPDGPEYVHHINRWDPVTLFSFFAFGSKRNALVEPGRGAEVRYFSDFSWSPHSMDAYQRNYPRA